MGRPAATREFLERLIDWAGTPARFRQLTGINAPNLTDYRSGKKPIAWKRLRTAAAQVTGLPAFHAILERHDVSGGFPTLALLPNVPGLYAFFDSTLKPIYWGKATKLNAEMRQTWNRVISAKKATGPLRGKKFRDVVQYVSAYRVERTDRPLRHDLESIGLRVFKDTLLNANSGEFQRMH